MNLSKIDPFSQPIIPQTLSYLPDQSSPSDQKEIEVTLPKETTGRDFKIVEALFPMYRQMCNQYRSLPWPEKIKKIVVLTQVVGGKGDIAATAKAITIMQRLCPNLFIDWVLTNSGDAKKHNPLSFLPLPTSSKVTFRGFPSSPEDNSPADFLLTGPVQFSWGIDYLEGRIGRKINGPTFNFLENAQDLLPFYNPLIEEKSLDKSNREIYQKNHRNIFSTRFHYPYGHIPMGLQQGSGVLLDKSRLEAPLSRGDCCPSYLLKIKDSPLRKDILESMNVFDDFSLPNYDKYSLNSGYAHYPVTWGKFIDCVALSEKEKDIVIVLNQKGEFDSLSDQEFQDQVLSKDHLEFLKQKGFGNITLKGQKTFLLQKDTKARHLTVIVRSSFAPDDMKQLQLASERLVATGDNSAVEAWCARCKLYLYEDVAKGGCKWKFLQQQVDLAEKISPNLSRLLALFGGDERLPKPLRNQRLDKQKMEELEQLLNDPKLGQATLQFCHHITKNYSFEPLFEGAIKRILWHHCIPELIRTESETLDEEFQVGLIDYFKNQKKLDILHVKKLPEIGEKVQQKVKSALLKK
jgi:hypothetical protein